MPELYKTGNTSQINYFASQKQLQTNNFRR